MRIIRIERAERRRHQLRAMPRLGRGRRLPQREVVSLRAPRHLDERLTGPLPGGLSGRVG